MIGFAGEFAVETEESLLIRGEGLRGRRVSMCCVDWTNGCRVRGKVNKCYSLRCRSCSFAMDSS